MALTRAGFARTRPLILFRFWLVVVPDSPSLTFICSAILAKFCLHQNVDRCRWISAALVCVGVLLLVK